MSLRNFLFQYGIKCIRWGNWVHLPECREWMNSHVWTVLRFYDIKSVILFIDALSQNYASNMWKVRLTAAFFICACCKYVVTNLLYTCSKCDLWFASLWCRKCQWFTGPSIISVTTCQSYCHAKTIFQSLFCASRLNVQTVDDDFLLSISYVIQYCH